MGHRDRFGLGPHFEHIERHNDIKRIEKHPSLRADFKCFHSAFQILHF